MTKRPAPSFEFARAYVAEPVFAPFNAAASHDDDAPERFDWSDDESNLGDDPDADTGVWDADVETLAAMAVARAHASASMRSINATLASTIERWR